MLMTKVGKISGRPSFWIELILALVIIFTSFCVAILFYKNIIPWGDEAQFIDPAVNFAEGKGFISSAWPYQRSNDFFIGNAPLYSFLTGLWFRVVGFGLLQARILNYIFVGLAAFLVWLTIYSSAFIPSRNHRLAALVLILCGYGLLVSYYSARYDALGMAIVAACYFCVYSGLVKAKNFVLLVLGILLPLAGYHLVVAFFILLAVDFYIEKKVRRDFVAISAGIILGLLILIGLAAYHDLLKKFFIITFGSQHTISGRFGKALMAGDMLGFVKTLSIYKVLIQDLSFLCALLALLSGLYVFSRNSKTSLARGEILMTIGLVVIIPFSLFIIGKYPVYYSWVGYSPAIIIALRWMEKASAASLIGYRNSIFILMLGAFALGLPNFLAFALYENRNVDYAVLENRVKDALHSGDIVYSDASTYFAARSITSPVFVSSYGQTKIVNGIPEHNSITALVIRRGELTSLSKLIPGDWVEANPDSTNAANKSDSNLQADITIFRRKLKVLESLQ